VGKELIAQGVEFHEKLVDWIKEGFYNQRSIELTRDNKRVLSVGILGAAPPAVKGLPTLDESLTEIAMEYSEKTNPKIIEFAKGDTTMLDEVEGLAKEDTFKNCSEICARFLENLEKILADGKVERLFEEVWEMQSDLLKELDLQAKFIEKIEKLEEKQEGEYSEKSIWKEFKDRITSLIKKRKETIVDQQKEKEYQDKIAGLETQLKEFADKEKAAKEVQAETERKAREEVQRVADEALTNEVKAFCDLAVKENRMTPAMRETDEKIMLDLSKHPEALKSFQEKYSKPVVPLGETPNLQGNENDKRPRIERQAEAYVKAHPKEFSNVPEELKIPRAIYLSVMGQIKFEDIK
jgi:hypothetical protein